MTTNIINPKTLATESVALYDSLLGEIISWESPTEVSIYQLREALRGAGFKEELARDMLPRHAWARAAKKMEDDRVIDKIEDAGGVMLFQFTKKHFEDKRWDFSVETILTLDKSTGRVSCTQWALEFQAQKLIDEQLPMRSASDVTRIVQNICRSQADLFPIRKQGGVYFVPERHAWVIGSLSTLMNAIGGTLTRFPVPEGNEQGRQSAAQIMQEELHARIEDHIGLIEKYSEKVTADVLVERTKAIVRLKGELESYEAVLGHFSSVLKEHWVKASDLLTQKIQGSENV